MTTDHVRVGKVKDAHGIRGELFIVLFSGEAAWLEDLEEVRLVSETVPLQAGQNPRTLKLKSARIHKNGLIVKSPDIPDRNYAETLKGWLMEIPESLFVPEKGEAIYLREILGFRVFTKEQGEVGTVQSFSHNDAQDLLVVKTASGDYEIPFVEAFVERIDYEAKEMHLELPVGLLGEEVDDQAAGDADGGDGDSDSDSGSELDGDLDGDLEAAPDSDPREGSEEA